MSNSLTKTFFNSKRIIGKIQGEKEGPTLVFFGGIHGNELSGVLAISRVIQELEENPKNFKGSLFGVKGNIPAQLMKKRFMDQDLNRIWTDPKIKSIRNKPSWERTIEEKELLDIYQLVLKIINTQKPPFYFIDFHTTSSKTLPFVTINDALINRRFAKLFPVPIVLGIEEYLDGPLLSYINSKGYVSLGFESGQHVDFNSVKNSIAFMWLALVYSGFITKKQVDKFDQYYWQLQSSAEKNANFYEIIYRHKIHDIKTFKMVNGFQSFEKVKIGTHLAVEGKENIKAKKNTIIFMPLYQKLGEEGFFLIRRIPTRLLRLSGFLRRTRINKVLPVLPGVSWKNKEKNRLIVNTKIAQFFSKPFFHLLGYRNQKLDKNHIVMNNREQTAKTTMYKNTWWYRITTLKSRYRPS